MGEPLAATLLSGAVLAMLWAADARQSRPRRGGCCPGVLLGALALVRPEYLASPCCSRLVVFARGGQGRWRRSWPGGAPARGRRWSSSRPGRSATRSPSTASCRSRPAAARCCSPAPTCPRVATREQVGAEVLERHPGLLGAAADLRTSGCAWSRSSPRSPPSATRAWKATRRSRGWAANSSGTTSPKQPLEYAGFVAAKIGAIWSHGPRDVMREPIWEALHWALVAFGLLGLVVLAWRRRWEALLLGDDLPLDHGDQRPAGRLAAPGRW